MNSSLAVSAETVCQKTVFTHTFVFVMEVIYYKVFALTVLGSGLTPRKAEEYLSLAFAEVPESIMNPK